jgi:hypothetical protein
MKKSRFTETQIIKALKDQEGGMKVADICRGPLPRQFLFQTSKCTFL